MEGDVQRRGSTSEIEERGEALSAFWEMQRIPCPQQKRVEGIDLVSDLKISLPLMAAHLGTAILHDWPACPMETEEEEESKSKKTGKLRGCYNSVGKELC